MDDTVYPLQPPPPAEQSLHDELADDNNNSTSTVPTSPLFPPAETETDELHEAALIASIQWTHEPELSEIAPTDTESAGAELVQNGNTVSSVLLPPLPDDSCVIAEGNALGCNIKKEECINKRDSGLASIRSASLHLLQTPEMPLTPNEIIAVSSAVAAGQMSEENKAHEQGSHPDFKRNETPDPDPRPPSTAPASQTFFKRSTPSIAARSLGAISTISREDEMLSSRVRSLYECGPTLIGCDCSSQISTSSDVVQRRPFRIIEEGGGVPETFRATERCRSSRNSFPGAGCKDGNHTNRRGGSINDILRESATVRDEDDIEVAALTNTETERVFAETDVDRYGFIQQPWVNSSAPNPTPGTDKPMLPPKRVATELLLQSRQPRKGPLTLKTLRLSPSAPEILRSPNTQQSIVLRDKENCRSRKWREMAVLAKKAELGKGSGAEWSFSTKNPKLIQRTWKGIPDCWRASAWHSFLSTSARTREIGVSDAELVSIYYDLLERPSSDDVQIDLDVPRTISSHVMFQQRYKGGQRLLFRVLHAVALHFPDVGYVQGMATIAATLLCYYDEEMAFIMLIRLWELRGLGELYRPEFGGLMAALDEFDTVWMKGSPISKKLTYLGVSPTAYATRWYLTIFNYSIPFAAQLRVWDVFMLLGDPSPELQEPSSKSSEFSGTLDILHATSAAVLNSMKSIVLGADFEDAMKNLTSFVPVKDEDMLMKVVKAEWKMRRRKNGAHFFSKATSHQSI